MQPLDALFMEREGATFQFQKIKSWLKQESQIQELK